MNGLAQQLQTLPAGQRLGGPREDNSVVGGVVVRKNVTVPEPVWDAPAQMTKRRSSLLPVNNINQQDVLRRQSLAPVHRFGETSAGWGRSSLQMQSPPRRASLTPEPPLSTTVQMASDATQQPAAPAGRRSSLHPLSQGFVPPSSADQSATQAAPTQPETKPNTTRRSSLHPIAQTRHESRNPSSPKAESAPPQNARRYSQEGNPNQGRWGEYPSIPDFGQGIDRPKDPSEKRHVPKATERFGPPVPAQNNHPQHSSGESSLPTRTAASSFPPPKSQPFIAPTIPLTDPSFTPLGINNAYSQPQMSDHHRPTFPANAPPPPVTPSGANFEPEGHGGLDSRYGGGVFGGESEAVDRGHAPQSEEAHGEEHMHGEPYNPGYGHPGGFERFVELRKAHGGSVDGLVHARNVHQGWKKVLLALFIGFLFIAPMLPIIDKFSGRKWLIIVMWFPILVFILGHVEFWSRSEIWHDCICKGIIVSFSKRPFYKTHLFLFNVAYVLFIVIMVYIALVPSNSVGVRFYTALMMIPALLFTFSLVKGIVGISGAHHIHTVNTFIELIGEERLLENEGIKVIDYSQLVVWYYDNKASARDFLIPLGRKPKDGQFSWNELHHLPATHNEEFSDLSFLERMTWGWRASNFLRVYRDAEY